MKRLGHDIQRNSAWTRWGLVVLGIALSLGVQPAAALAQWATSGNDISNTNTGFVGIGTTTPSQKLDVNGALQTNSSFITNTATDADGGAGVYFRTANNERWNITRPANTNDLQFLNVNIQGNLLMLPYGNVGIGTTTPGDKLTVQGGALSFNNPTNPVPYVGLDYDPTGDAMRFRGNVNTTALNTTYVTIQRTTGSVGIGTTSPSQKLDVNGALQTNVGFITNTATDAGGGAGVYFRTAGDERWNITRPANTNDLQFLNVNIQGNLLMLPYGNVGIGTSTPAAKLHVAGDVLADGNLAAKYQDVAEWVPARRALPAGTVVVLDTAHVNQIVPSAQAYDTRVAGVVSATPGLLLGEAGEHKVKVATTGRVKVKADASRGAIAVGDLLVTSDTEGVAMRSEPLNLGGVPIHRPGTVLGKALEPLSEGEGEILVLLTLQ